MDWSKTFTINYILFHLLAIKYNFMVNCSLSKCVSGDGTLTLYTTIQIIQLNEIRYSSFNQEYQL